MFKKIFVISMLLVLLTSCAPEQTSSAVDVPDAVEVGIAGLLIALFSAGAIYIFERTGLDLRQYSIPVAVTFATYVVAELQSWINTIPPVHDPLLMIALNVLGALLAGFGVLRLVSRQPSTLLNR